ncbi:hypothetical protein [Paracoccus sp. S1E-3]|uniref:hypothetical protein n=1 Tax=Paracoccus sp. S1E-3 TaxID=2756130 RepID=UPI0021066C64|nr:hypothetical protein [Paracoccus sp. S1E-3]
MTGTLRRQMRMLALWAMMLPFLGVSLIANGVMPSRGADGYVTFVICTGTGMVEMAFDPVTMEPVETGGLADMPSDDDETAAKACAWSGMQAAFDLPHSVLWMAPAQTSRRADPLRVETALLMARATGLPPSTGPPAAI